MFCLFGDASVGFALQLLHDSSFVLRSASNLSWLSPEPRLGRSGLCFDLTQFLIPALCPGVPPTCLGLGWCLSSGSVGFALEFRNNN